MRCPVCSRGLDPRSGPIIFPNFTAASIVDVIRRNMKTARSLAAASVGFLFFLFFLPANDMFDLLLPLENYFFFISTFIVHHISFAFCRVELMDWS